MERAVVDNPWPQWPRVFGELYGHAEVKLCLVKTRGFSVLTKEFVVTA
jgi:hypothetical protein